MTARTSKSSGGVGEVLVKPSVFAERAGLAGAACGGVFSGLGLAGERTPTPTIRLRSICQGTGHTSSDYYKGYFTSKVADFLATIF